MALNEVTRGPFAVGEIPEPATFTWTRPASAGGGPLDMSAPGWTVVVDIVKPDLTVVNDRTATITDGAGGTAEMTFVDGDLDQAGDFKLIAWAANTGVRIPSDILVMQVFAAPGTV